jgi:hypothetical protein
VEVRRILSEKHDGAISSLWSAREHERLKERALENNIGEVVVRERIVEGLDVQMTDSTALLLGGKPVRHPQHVFMERRGI